MESVALAMVLGSACLHAGWNYLVKAGSDRLVTAWTVVAAGALVLSPVLVIDAPSAEALGFVAVSGLIHTGYFFSLARAYDQADLSVAYPIARGAAPLLIACGGAVLLNESLAAIEWAALVTMSAGLLWLSYRPGAGTRIRWALMTALMIAGYTVLDAAGVRRTEAVLSYTAGVFALNVVFLTPVVIALRGWASIRDSIGGRPLRGIASGGLSVSAYALVLGAALVAPIGLVAAVRETSIVVGALIGVFALREAFGLKRVAAAAGIAVGVIFLALG